MVSRIRGCLIFCGLFLLPNLLPAQELTPMEKALLALSQKEKPAAQAAGNSLTAGVQAAANTRNAQAMLPAAPLTVVNAGNSLTPVAGKPMFLTLGAPTQADAFNLTANATADDILLSWSNTGTAWKNFSAYIVTKARVQKEPELEYAPAALETQYRDLTQTVKDVYWYQITAVDNQGLTLAASAVITSQRLRAFLPAAPLELVTEVEDERVRLRWKKPEKTTYDVAGYAVYRQTSDQTWESLNKKFIQKEEYFDETGDPQQNYAYQVRAVDVRGQTGNASAAVEGFARARSRNSMVLMSTAYRGLGHKDAGFNADAKFTYYIGTLYGQQDEELSAQPLYLDPISLWLIGVDAKYTFLTEEWMPFSMAAGGKGDIMLFAGQQDSAGGSFTFSQKSELQYLWGGYATLSRSFGPWGMHGGYLYGTEGDFIFYLSKYMNYDKTENSRQVFYAGFDFPIARRMNAAIELLYPLNANLQSDQHPYLINCHIDRLFNFDISYLHWDQGWAFLGYFNIRFTVFPGQ